MINVVALTRIAVIVENKLFSSFQEDHMPILEIIIPKIPKIIKVISNIKIEYLIK